MNRMLNFRCSFNQLSYGRLHNFIELVMISFSLIPINYNKSKLHAILLNARDFAATRKSEAEKLH